MIKRVLCVMAAIMVASSSAMAWTAESFIGNDYDEQESYDFEPVYDYPMQPMRMMSARSTSSANESYSVVFDDPSSTSYSSPDLPYAMLYGEQNIYVPSYGAYFPSPFIGGEYYFDTDPVVVNLSNWYRVMPESSIIIYRLPYSYEDTTTSTFVSWEYVQFNGYVVTYDIPIPNDTYGISFSPNFHGHTECHVGGITYSELYDCKVTYLINGEIVDSFVTDTGYYTKESTYSYTEPIESASIILGFNVPSNLTQGLPSDSSVNGNLNIWMRGYISLDSSINIGFLTGNSILNYHNQEGQDSINQHNAIESEWTGSMTSNFNALSIETFSFPSGLVSAFGLITGIFNDLWNGMGEYKIAYVFPLTLGIALLLIGRISKFDGGQSSSKRNRGDDGA